MENIEILAQETLNKLYELYYMNSTSRFSPEFVMENALAGNVKVIADIKKMLGALDTEALALALV